MTTNDTQEPNLASYAFDPTDAMIMPKSFSRENQPPTNFKEG